MGYSTHFGIEHLPKLATASTVAFDTETCQLQPEVGKLRLLQLILKFAKPLSLSIYGN